MIRIKKIILYLCMVALLVSNISICAFASDLNDGVNDGFDRYMGGTNIKGFNSWEITDKKSLFANNIATFFADIGMYFRGQSNQSLLNIFTEHLIETNRIENADSLDSYIASHLTANDEETELYMSSDMVNSLHETAVTYIEEETQWYTHKTSRSDDFLKYYIDNFATSEQYNNLKKYINDNPDKVFLLGCKNVGIIPYDEDGNQLTTITGMKFYTFDMSQYDFVATSYRYNKFELDVYNKNWDLINYDEWCIDSDGNIIKTNYKSNSYTFYITGKHPNNTVYCGYEYEGYTSSMYIDNIPVVPIDYNALVTSNGQYIRIYKTLADLKQYTVGQRPYYITDAFNNYDSTVDNSTTITQTEIDNSVTYGDVYNYITNNYDNPDGLTEDELRAILEEYLSQINNSGGTGSGGDSGGSSDDSGGPGLSGFLDGLGSIGNAILAILGKLMEILGSAIELVTGSITDLITIIPNSVGELLGALFPVFPEEWIKAITLSLVLGVIVGIVRMFK